MVSVLIETGPWAEPLARTLAALVPGAVNGHVRDVTVVPDGAEAADHEAINEVCEFSGCGFWTERDMRGAIAKTRSDWLLLMRAGAIPEPGWGEALRAHSGSGGIAGHFRRSSATARPWTQAWTRDDRLALGVFMTKRQALLLAAHENTLSDLAKRSGARPLKATMLVPQT